MTALLGEGKACNGIRPSGANQRHSITLEKVESGGVPQRAVPDLVSKLIPGSIGASQMGNEICGTQSSRLKLSRPMSGYCRLAKRVERQTNDDNAQNKTRNGTKSSSSVLLQLRHTISP